METKHINLVHGLPKNSPSVKNILQGLSALDDRWRIKEHPIRSSLFGSNFASKGGEITIYQLNIFKKYIDLMNKKSDILIIHKPFSEFIPDLLLNSTIAERLFTKFGNVVFSTYDATYINNEKKTEFLFRNSDLIYATSKRIHKKALNISTDNRVSYIPPSVDTEFFTPKKDAYKKPEADSLVLGWIGNAELHKKDIIKLSENLNRLQSVNITLRFLTGGSTVDSKLQSKLNDVTSDIDYIQWVPWEDVPKVINSFDVGLAPLCDTEFNRARSSEKIREYMACGIPVIASDIGENRYLISDNCGFLVSNKNDWENAVDKLTDDELRRSMGGSARSHVVNNYSISVISNKIENNFTNLLDN
jgi:glycosyltransferase involved in cell wall biosynthesis